ncbi:MAG: hypothetical protein ACLRWP_19355 [Bilophila wadsworthia]
MPVLGRKVLEMVPSGSTTPIIQKPKAPLFSWMRRVPARGWMYLDRRLLAHAFQQ